MQAQAIKDDTSVVGPAINKARTTFLSGKTKSIEFRIAQLKALQSGLQKMNQELVDAVKADIGRESFVTWFSEISILVKEIDHTVGNLKKWTQEIVVDTPVFLGPAKSKIVPEPLGVVGIMGSWNFPLYTNLSPLISVIASGNCAVIKPSEIAPNTLRKIKTMIARNMDTSAFVCIEGQVEVAKALSSSKLDSICFTGSSDKGRLVAQAAG